jgi:hypothetical protein
MHCTNCGQDIPDGATVCPNCGAPVPLPAPAAPVVSPTPLVPGSVSVPPFAAAPPRRATSGVSVASLIVAVLAVLCIVLSVFLTYQLAMRVYQELGTQVTEAEVQRLVMDPAFQTAAIGVIVSLALSQLLALSGLILGVLGVTQEGKQPTQSGKALGIVGIVLNLLPLLCCVTAFVFYFASMMSSGGA